MDPIDAPVPRPSPSPLQSQVAQAQPKPLRVAVIGLSGAGKTRFAKKLAARTGIDQIELDLINWRPGWYDRYQNEFPAFRADVEAAIAAPQWVCAGGYSRVRDMIYGRANTLVWIDLPFHLVLRQVMVRSLTRAALKTPALNGNIEHFRRWADKGHPIQIVLRKYARKRAQFEAELGRPETAHLNQIRCRSRRAVAEALETLGSGFVPARPGIQIGADRRPEQVPSHPGDMTGR